MSNRLSLLGKSFLTLLVSFSIVSMQFSISANSHSSVLRAEETNSKTVAPNKLPIEIADYDFTKEIGSDYKPTTEDEKKLWEEADKLEADFKKNSSKIIDDPELNAYVKEVLCKVIGNERCAPIRLYLVRTTQFNALMAANGMMQVWSGLLIRMRDEAQLASILAHEYAHYVRRHSLQSMILAKNIESTTYVPYVGLFATLSSVGSLFAFSREMESEADRLALEYIYEAGYKPQSSSDVWKQLLEESELNEEKEKKNNLLTSFFSTHPTSEDRMQILSDLAQSKDQSKAIFTNKEQYRAALGGWWPKFINDQIKAKNFKSGEFLVDQLAQNGWDADLYFAKAELFRKRGEKEDFAKAVIYYQNSIDAGSDKPENWRGMGLSLMRDNKKEEGKKVLLEYLRRLPNAIDKRMIQLLTGTTDQRVNPPKELASSDAEENKTE